MVLTIGELEGMSVTLKPYQIDASLSPVQTYTSGEVTDVVVKNKKTTTEAFKLCYQIDTIDSELISNDFKYTITKSTDSGSTYTPVKTGNFSSATNDSTIEIYREEIDGNNTTYLYKVYIWIDSAGSNQANMQGKSFVSELRADLNIYISSWGEEAFIDNAPSTYVTSSTGINFGAKSSATNGQGLYVRAGTENTQHPIYYYRGAVTNNNVLLNDFCWKIVRTTETGGVKMIYNGLPTSGSCINTTGTETQLADLVKFNYNYYSAADVGYMYGTRYQSTTRTAASLVEPYKYGGSFSYSGGSYTLTDTITSTGTWSTDYMNLSNNHYTCFNATGVCNEVYYIYETYSGGASYITITSGKSVETALNEMFTPNTTSSTIKDYIDNWFETNFGQTGFEAMLEDTVWCNDRSTSSLGAFNPNGGPTYDDNTSGHRWNDISIVFSGYTEATAYRAPSLGCPNLSDRFTKNSENGNGKLNYSVGLLTAAELKLAGARAGGSSSFYKNTSFYLYTNQSYWLMTPYTYSQSEPLVFLVFTGGNINVDYYSSNRTAGVRPAISLKPGGTWSGNGTSDSPYQVSWS